MGIKERPRGRRRKGKHVQMFYSTVLNQILLFDQFFSIPVVHNHPRHLSSHALVLDPFNVDDISSWNTHPPENTDCLYGKLNINLCTLSSWFSSSTFFLYLLVVSPSTSGVTRICCSCWSDLRHPFPSCSSSVVSSSSTVKCQCHPLLHSLSRDEYFKHGTVEQLHLSWSTHPLNNIPFTRPPTRQS